MTPLEKASLAVEFTTLVAFAWGTTWIIGWWNHKLTPRSVALLHLLLGFTGETLLSMSGIFDNCRGYGLLAGLVTIAVDQVIMNPKTTSQAVTKGNGSVGFDKPFRTFGTQ